MARKRNFELYERITIVLLAIVQDHYLGEVKLCVGVVVIIIRINELKRS